MEKRAFLHTVAATGIGLAYPSIFAQPATPSKTPSLPALAQSLVGVDSHARAVDLDDYAGKVCLISFFTSGCNLCSNDLKLMREFYMGNKARNFILLGVNMDERKQDFMEYMRLVGLTIPIEQRFPIVWRNAPQHRDSFGAIAKKPTHFVLNKAHKQVLRREGVFQPDDWDDLWSNLA